MENDITIRQAEDYELELVKRFYREHKMRPQAARSDDVYIALRGNKIIAALRLCAYGDAWLLRSMCVRSEVRNTGIGSYMLAELKDIFSNKSCYCFPFEHLDGFYKRAGFSEVAVDDVPVSIADKYRQYADKGKRILLMKFG